MLLIYVVEFTVKYLLLFVHKVRTYLTYKCYLVTNVSRKSVVSGPLETDIGTVWKMAEMLAEKKT